MKISIIEVPLDFGANRRGVDMGPSAVRLAGLKESLIALGHEPEESMPRLPVPIQEFEEVGDPKIKFLEPIAVACSVLAERVEASMDAGKFPLVVGGDHSIAVGTLAGLGAHYRKTDVAWGVLWIDAHGDFNSPETSPSGNIHGMSLAASAGIGHPRLTALHGDFRKIDPANVVLIGIRDLDSGEKQNLRSAGVQVFTISDIDRLGMSETVNFAMEYLKDRVDALHVSFDVDSIDPRFAPGVGTPVRGGLSYREVGLLMESAAKTGLIRSAEVVEVNPILDVRNQTARLAVEIIARLLGASTY
jgi:arginase